MNPAPCRQPHKRSAGESADHSEVGELLTGNRFKRKRLATKGHSAAETEPNLNGPSTTLKAKSVKRKKRPKPSIANMVSNPIEPQGQYTPSSGIDAALVRSDLAASPDSRTPMKFLPIASLSDTVPSQEAPELNGLMLLAETIANATPAWVAPNNDQSLVETTLRNYLPSPPSAYHTVSADSDPSGENSTNLKDLERVSWTPPTPPSSAPGDQSPSHDCPPVHIISPRPYYIHTCRIPQVWGLETNQNTELALK